MSSKDDQDQRQRIREIYRYDEMSNKVLQSDKKLIDNATKDAIESQPKSMAGRINLNDMGKSVVYETPTEPLQNPDSTGTAIGIVRDEPITYTNTRGQTILDMDGVTKINYYPTTAENSQVYEEILEWVTDMLGDDIPHETIIETSDLLISVLKEDEENKDGLIQKKKKIVEDELSCPIDTIQFQRLVKLTNNLTDYGINSHVEEENIVPVMASDDEEQEEQTNLNRRDDDLTRSNGHSPTLADNGMSPHDDNNGQTIRHSVNIDNKPEEIRIGSDKLGSEKNKISIFTVDEFYVERLLLKELKSINTEMVPNLSSKILLAIEGSSDSDKEIEKKLLELLDFDSLSLVNFIIQNKYEILWGCKLSKANKIDKEELIDTMIGNGLQYLVDEYKNRNSDTNKRIFEDINTEPAKMDINKKKLKIEDNSNLPDIIDLSKLAVNQNPKTLSSQKISLPAGSFKRVKPSYEEIHIPPPDKPDFHHDLVAISELPDWTHEAFPSEEIQHLNLVQSKVFNSTFNTDNNLLICAPTGAGKTNIALLAILRGLSLLRDDITSKLNINRFKAIYIAPLKALVQEQVREFQRRLSPFGIKVSELTGDSNLTSQQISETHILVSTPEKWDIITRKSNELTFVKTVDLVIIDEVHLLNDTRGPVLESIVARAHLSTNPSERPRIVALSATLPNYKDVARFLRVPDDGLFYFDSSYRPCPLSQQFCGITERNALKKLNAINEACYDKVLESVSEGHQVIIFVHSRKDTIRTAQYLKTRFSNENNLSKIIKSENGIKEILKRESENGIKEILKRESENVNNSSLQTLISHGIGIHHAGLNRNDRSLSEDLFADGLLQVLVSTATLAWGVNLPAHTVIIKGTDVYSPEKGSWVQLSSQDILQMLGRAGRPRYDTHGEGVIITAQSDVQYYLAILNQQLPIESQFISSLIDSLNAEIVSGNVKNRDDARKWLSLTYLYVRMLVSPEQHNVPEGSKLLDRGSYLDSLVHSALLILHDRNLSTYDAIEDRVESTELGKIASRFYIKYNSMSVYCDNLNENSTLFDIFKIFSMSEEFKYLSVRQEERKELKELTEKCPIPISKDTEDHLFKVNILLQSYISRLNFEGFALNADMIFITQNAGRLLNSMKEICLKKRWSKPTKLLLDLCKAVDRRMWVTNSPLRQFSSCPVEVIRKAEASSLPWVDYMKLDSPSSVGKAIRSEKYAKTVYDLLKRFPSLTSSCTIQPITSTLLSFELEIIPGWIWDNRYHSPIESFTILVEDTNGDNILYSTNILIHKDYINQEHIVNFYIQLNSSEQRTLPPNYFITIISDRWLNSKEQIVASFHDLRIPRKFPQPTQLINMSPVSTSSLENEEFMNTFDFSSFNKFITPLFEIIYNSNENMLLCCAKASGKTTAAELALLNHWRQNKGRAVYINPVQQSIDNLLVSWNGKFSDIAGGKLINKLTNDNSINLKVLAQSHLILATPSQFINLSRRWRQRKNIQSIELVIYDNAQRVSDPAIGPSYECLISQMNLMSSQLEKDLRIVGLSSCIANARDFGDWMGVNKKYIFNYSPLEQIYPVDIHLDGYDDVRGSSYSNLMLKKACNYVYNESIKSKSTIMFVSTRTDCIGVSKELISLIEDGKYGSFSNGLNKSNNEIEKLQNKNLKSTLERGIGLIYEGISPVDLDIIFNLFEAQLLKVLVLTKEYCYDFPKSDNIVVLGTKYYDEKEHRYRNYTSDMLNEMIAISFAKNNSKHVGNIHIMTDTNMKFFYKKFIEEALPIESNLLYFLHDFIIDGIFSGIVENKQDCVDLITYSLFYRRIHANPSYYGVVDTSPLGISQYLSQLVENIVTELESSSIVEIENNQESSTDPEQTETISPINGALICVQYNISYLSFSHFVSKLSQRTTMKEILEILSGAIEFDFIPVRRGELSYLYKLQKILPYKFPENGELNVLKFKVFLLLQAYFSRVKLTADHQYDLNSILLVVLPLINAVVDILSSDGCLNATTAMDLSQMVVQGVWDTDSPLKQIPFFDESILKTCAIKNIDTVYDIMALEDEEREEIMTMEEKQLIKIAEFVNNYPNIELEYSLKDANSIKVDDDVTITVTVNRDEDPETLNVTSEKYPYGKLENWWVVLGEVSTRELLAIKRISLSKETQSYDLQFTVNTEGEHKLSLWCVCDSYLDADKEVSFELNVKS
ncbi:hypothetical protein Kpol_1075p5 [Vanderwaltozyma polyspora DSM 70294]|uniref:U5 small nuclear ribonucleoprotein 200 kDa helicase n=1 Tax=Vanderwaltozyma polyspora (strain ATCC 22028 / DSM 70294 / BCRC 21397 / CBS 2163 / NBRC 10782 / NRRL Y-8283 / UCD 57-17) TaxID=436907 RepID=A7TSN3_VANPO|nr:uncharacterized protein Kpol_1075p5 [Vanderwaltozyma polyspora DSM 70294]EDO14727.1 hypothetical protein Kpol_1075p5 [Vanderwaltozyma polyspora DSM 70294]